MSSIIQYRNLYQDPGFLSKDNRERAVIYRKKYLNKNSNFFRFFVPPYTLSVYFYLFSSIKENDNKSIYFSYNKPIDESNLPEPNNDNDGVGEIPLSPYTLSYYNGVIRHNELSEKLIVLNDPKAYLPFSTAGEDAATSSVVSGAWFYIYIPSTQVAERTYFQLTIEMEWEGYTKWYQRIYWPLDVDDIDSDTYEEADVKEKIFEIFSYQCTVNNNKLNFDYSYRISSRKVKVLIPPFCTRCEFHIQLRSKVQEKLEFCIRYGKEIDETALWKDWLYNTSIPSKEYGILSLQDIESSGNINFIYNKPNTYMIKVFEFTSIEQLCNAGDYLYIFFNQYFNVNKINFCFEFYQSELLDWIEKDTDFPTKPLVYPTDAIYDEHQLPIEVYSPKAKEIYASVVMKGQEAELSASLTVSISPIVVEELATWRIKHDFLPVPSPSGSSDQWFSSGETVTGLIPDSSYVLEFSDVAGYKKPEDSVISIRVGKNYASGLYTRIRRRLSV